MSAGLLTEPIPPQSGDLRRTVGQFPLSRRPEPKHVLSQVEGPKDERAFSEGLFCLYNTTANWETNEFFSHPATRFIPDSL